MSAREEILSRLGTGSASAERRPSVHPLQTDHLDGAATTGMLIERLTEYDARVHLTTREGIPAVLAATFASAGMTRIVVPHGISRGWLGETEILSDQPPLTFEALDAADATLTLCATAIAETGTIVLDGGPGMGRRALSLVPDRLVCVVREAQIVSSIPAALAQLDGTRPLTFISGPSATVDIEMVRVVGVHGPRRLDVVLVAAGPG
jgi:L-lactate dehydrogenase complex protein LldG